MTPVRRRRVRNSRPEPFLARCGIHPEDTERGVPRLPSPYVPIPWSGAFLTAADLVIVFCFAAEYGAGLLLADDRARFLRDPWRLLDAFIIVTALIALFPFAHAALSNTPALRLIRLSRVALLGSRAGAAMSSGEPPPPDETLEPEHPLTAQALVDVDAPRFSPCDWDAVLRQIGSDEDDWIFLSGVRREHLNAVAEKLRLPPAILRGKLFDATDLPRAARLRSSAPPSACSERSSTPTRRSSNNSSARS